LQTDPDGYEKARQEVETNYLAPVCLIQLLIDLLRQQPSSAIVNITTIGAYLPLTLMPGYSASKAALSSFTCSLRLQLAGTPIKVFEVLPPPVDTDLVRAFHMHKMPPEQLARKVLQGLRKDRHEMSIGTARVLRWMARLAPRLSEDMAHKQLLKANRNR
jgi:short-subunit dehydrogenase involved in D-alanine esterification of teichoic acids